MHLSRGRFTASICFYYSFMSKIFSWILNIQDSKLLFKPSFYNSLFEIWKWFANYLIIQAQILKIENSQKNPENPFFFISSKLFIIIEIETCFISLKSLIQVDLNRLNVKEDFMLETRFDFLPLSNLISKLKFIRKPVSTLSHFFSSTFFQKLTEWK